MICNVTLTANAGVIIDAGPRIAVDALHNVSTKLFSTLDPKMTNGVFDVFSQKRPDAFLVTHTHMDHYSQELVQRAHELYPSMALVDPSAIRAGRGKIRLGSFTIEWYPLPHSEVTGFEKIPNYAFIINIEGKRIFLSGDSDPFAPETVQLVDALEPDLAMLNFTWITMTKARTITKSMHAKNIGFFHIPSPMNDPYSYNLATEQAVKKYAPQAVIFNGFLQCAEYVL